MKKLITLITSVLLLVSVNCLAVDRCRDYVVEVRNAHIMYLGLDFPWWYGMGQLRQESGCRNVTAFDGGQGIAQFMPATAEYIVKLMHENVSPNNPEQATKMQAFYISWLQKKQNWTDSLWITYQIYNGGKGLLYKEYKRTGKPDHDAMRAVCVRRVITLKSGQKLDFCDVNYDYSKNINKYGSAYKMGKDQKNFW